MSQVVLGAALIVLAVLGGFAVIWAWDRIQRARYERHLTPAEREELRGFCATNSDWRMWAALNQR